MSKLDANRDILREVLIGSIGINREYLPKKTNTTSKTFREDTSLLEIFEWIEQNSPSMSIPNLDGKIVLTGKIRVTITHPI